MTASDGESVPLPEGHDPEADEREAATVPLVSYATTTTDPEAAQLVAAALPLLGLPLAAWLEDPQQPDGLSLRETLDLPAAEALAGAWPQGRLFGPAGELRWEPDPSGGRAFALLVEQSLTVRLPGLFGTADGRARIVSPGSEELLLLWGELRGSHWQERRIPAIDRLIPPEWKQPERQGSHAALRVRFYELDWPEQQTVRQLVRYLAYVPDYLSSTRLEEPEDERE
jgi:hypothetical protein